MKKAAKRLTAHAARAADASARGGSGGGGGGGGDEDAGGGAVRTLLLDAAWDRLPEACALARRARRDGACPPRAGHGPRCALTFPVSLAPVRLQAQDEVRVLVLEMLRGGHAQAFLEAYAAEATAQQQQQQQQVRQVRGARARAPWGSPGA